MAAETTTRATRGRARRRFSRWQFDPEGPEGVIPGLPEVNQALAVSPLARIAWLTKPNPYLEGRTPLQALQEGEEDRVVVVARGVGGLSWSRWRCRRPRGGRTRCSTP